MDFQWIFKRFSMDFQSMFNGFPMDFQRFFNGFSMDLQWIFNGFQSIVNGLSMDFQWIFNWFLIDFQWIFNGFSLDFQCIFHGFPKDVQWVADGFSIDFLYIFRWVSIWFPVDFQWIRNGSRAVFKNPGEYSGFFRNTVGSFGILESLAASKKPRFPFLCTHRFSRSGFILDPFLVTFSLPVFVLFFKGFLAHSVVPSGYILAIIFDVFPIKKTIQFSIDFS